MNIFHAMTTLRLKSRWLVMLCLCSWFGGVHANPAEDGTPVVDGPFSSNAASHAESPSTAPSGLIQGNKKGHIGLSVGQARFNMPCIEGMECRRKGRVITFYAGGELSQRWGFEFAYMRLSNLENAGNSVSVKGLNMSVMGELPIASRCQLTGRLGTNFARTRMDQGLNPASPGGSATGFGLSYGAGLNWDVSESWSASADWNRHDFKFVTGRDSVDTATVSMRYRY